MLTTSALRDRAPKIVLACFVLTHVINRLSCRGANPEDVHLIRTDPGGAQAPFTIEEAIPKVVDTLRATRGTPGMHYLDRFGEIVPW